MSSKELEPISMRNFFEKIDFTFGVDNPICIINGHEINEEKLLNLGYLRFNNTENITDMNPNYCFLVEDCRNLKKIYVNFEYYILCLLNSGCEIPAEYTNLYLEKLSLNDLVYLVKNFPESNIYDLAYNKIVESINIKPEIRDIAYRPKTKYKEKIMEKNRKLRKEMIMRGKY